MPLGFCEAVAEFMNFPNTQSLTNSFKVIYKNRRY